MPDVWYLITLPLALSTQTRPGKWQKTIGKVGHFADSALIHRSNACAPVAAGALASPHHSWKPGSPAHCALRLDSVLPSLRSQVGGTITVRCTLAAAFRNALDIGAFFKRHPPGLPCAVRSRKSARACRVLARCRSKTAAQASRWASSAAWQTKVSPRKAGFRGSEN